MNSEGLKIRPLSIRSCKQGAGIYFRVLGFLFTLFMQAFVAHADEMPPQSGVIAMASEPVSVKTTPLKGKVTSRTANTGQPIYLNDEIKTSATSKAQILLKDQSVFNIGPNSTMVIDKFVYDPQKSALNVSIQKGAFKFVSGKIANTSDEAMKVSLPNATIAVRGTGVAGIVEPNGSATVMLLHGTVDVTSVANNSTSTLSKSGWGVQINPTGVVSPPAPLPADVTRNIMQTSKVTQAVPATASSNSGSNTANTAASSSSSTSGASSGTTANSTSTASGSANTSSNATATLTTPEVTNTVTPVAASVATTAPATTSAIQSVTAGSGVTPTSSSTTLASSSSGTFSSAAATASLNLGNAQLTTANSYLVTAQTQSSNAVSQASSAATEATSAATQAATAATQATIAANASATTPALAIRANELAATAAALASTASTSASSYSSQAVTSNTNAAQASTSSIQASNLAIGYAVTATQQSNADTGLVSQAKTLSTQGNTTSVSATLANTQAALAASAAQTSADQAVASSFAAANSALSAYQSALTIAQTLTPYETITQAIDINGVLKPLGNVTFSTTNVAMSCINGVNCGGATSSATINSHSFIFNFLNSTVTNNYNISYNNFNGYTGTVSGSNAATAINWSSATVVSLPVTGQVSSAPVAAAMDVLLSSVGTQNLTKRANLATVFTSISSPINGGGTAYMGVGTTGYKILGK